jgi:hypothetical protein
VNYPPPTFQVWWGLLPSLGIASTTVDFLRPGRFGLTYPKEAVALVPNAKIRFPFMQIKTNS